MKHKSCLYVFDDERNGYKDEPGPPIDRAGIFP